MEENKKQRSWFALRVYYDKVVPCRALFVAFNDVLRGINPPGPYFPKELEGEPMDYYAPLYRDTYVNNKGKQVVVQKAFIRSLFFMHSTLQQAECFEMTLPYRAGLYRTMGEEPHVPIRIPEKQMKMFMRVTSGSQDGLDYFEDNAFSWKKGVRVRVTGGRFEGLEGEIKRIDGDKRLVVAIEGICAVATSYIPKCFLEKIE